MATVACAATSPASAPTLSATPLPLLLEAPSESKRSGDAAAADGVVAKPVPPPPLGDMDARRIESENAFGDATDDDAGDECLAVASAIGVLASGAIKLMLSGRGFPAAAEAA